MIQNRKESELESVENYSIDRGELYCYRRIDESEPEKDRDDITVDCGFNVWRNPGIENIDKFKNFEIFKTEKRNNRYYISEVLEKSDDNSGKYFTYKGHVDRVIDGDTLLVNIDLGFDTVIRQRIRLRGVDTPEIDFDEGKKARSFVNRVLGKSDCIVIKTYKTDLYDRYISDVFFFEDESDPEIIAREGILLNKRLLEKGLARMV